MLRTCCRQSHSTKVKLLGEAAHLLTVVRGHSCTTSFVFSSTRITDSLVIPSSRGTSLFLPFIFSCQIAKHQTTVTLAINTYTDDSFKERTHIFFSAFLLVLSFYTCCVRGLKPLMGEEEGSREVTQQSSVLFNCCFIEQGLHRL